MRIKEEVLGSDQLRMSGVCLFLESKLEIEKDPPSRPVLEHNSQNVSLLWECDIRRHYQIHVKYRLVVAIRYVREDLLQNFY